MAKSCSINGCDKPHRAQGYCAVHYNSKRKTGALQLLPKLSRKDRFYGHVDKNGDLPAHRPDLGKCWNWTASTMKGYGQFILPGISNSAHRAAWYFEYGYLPNGLELDHACSNRLCVNPSHLRPVNSSENNHNQPRLSSRNKSGYRGVWRSPNGKRWVAKVGYHGKTIYVGTFDTPEAAGDAARQKRIQLFTHNEYERS